MNRRSFLAFSTTAALALALHGLPSGAASAAPPQSLRLQAGRIVSPSAEPTVNFGPGVEVTELYQSDGIWYAHLKSTASPVQFFWLKSYNRRAWGSLDWKPRRTARARI